VSVLETSDVHAAPLNGRDHGVEITVAGEQDNPIDVLRGIERRRQARRLSFVTLSHRQTPWLASS